MKILLIGRIPAYFESIRNDSKIFPPFQIQTYWLNALKSLGASVDVFITSKSLVLPTKLSAKYEVFIQKMFPNAYAKGMKFKNIAFKWRVGNYWRSYQVIQLIKSNKYNAIIIAGGISELTGLELKVAKRNSIKVIMLHGEDPLISATSYEKQNIESIESIVVNDPVHKAGWCKLGASKVTTLPYSGIDPTVYKDQGKKRTIPLIFIGTLLKDRQEILKKIISFKPTIYGYIPPSIGLAPELKNLYKGEAWGQKMIELYNQSQIALNFAPPHMPVGGNLRLFEIPACGAVQIANRCPSEWFEEGKEIILYNNNEDLCQKIAYYLEHPKQRQQVAKAGYTKTHTDYTYEQRFKTILEI